jgi:pyruvate-formate lyase
MRKPDLLAMVAVGTCVFAGCALIAIGFHEPSEALAEQRQYTLDDVRDMEDPTKHVCYKVALGSEENEKRRMLDIVVKVCKDYDRADQHELNRACKYLLGSESPIPPK